MTLTNVDFQNAKKKLAKTKEEKYLMMEFSYDRKLILPYKKALEVLQGLEDAFVFCERWDKPPDFKPLSDELKCQPMTEEEITTIKVAQLLGISYSDAKKLKEETP
jgi:hypothetical protein